MEIAMKSLRRFRRMGVGAMSVLPIEWLL